MATLMQPEGWDEVRVTEVRITQRIAQYLTNVEGWCQTDWRMDFSDRKPTCDCCTSPWERLPADGSVWRIETTHGRKVICEVCKDRLQLDDEVSATEALALELGGLTLEAEET